MGQTIVLSSETVIALGRSVRVQMRVCVGQQRMKVTRGGTELSPEGVGQVGCSGRRRGKGGVVSLNTKCPGRKMGNWLMKILRETPAET